MLAWKASCADLLHDFARAAFLFSPNPTVQEYVINNHVQADKDAAERLIAKWLLPEGTLETERSRLMASLVTTLWKEWGEFCNHTGGYEKEYMWIAACDGKTPPHLWHSYFSGHTKVLQKLACRVCSKVLGIGSAERSWKKFKGNMSAERSKLSPKKAKMQATIASIHAAENNDQDRAKRMRAGVLWDDEDFATLHLDPHCLPLDCAPDDEVVRRTTRVFRGWIEDWEQEDVGPKGLNKGYLRSMVVLNFWILMGAKYFQSIQIERLSKRKSVTTAMNCFVFWMILMT
mmetsp:Transcript_2661/g.5122  ORF Transcript_2661/g.5122 Transcript_2661/m.5122 type:complete len:288 (+) Transcript_2661:1342-2205(+)